MENKKHIMPNFKNEDEEREYWGSYDLSIHFTPSDFKKISFPELKPTYKSVSVKMPGYLFIRLKEKANSLNIPYKALINRYIADGLLSEAR